MDLSSEGLVAHQPRTVSGTDPCHDLYQGASDGVIATEDDDIVASRYWRDEAAQGTVLAWPFTAHSPPLGRRTSRSMKPPRKAVARSALYVPSLAELEDLMASNTPLRFSKSSRYVGIPFVHMEDVASLTALPSSRHDDQGICDTHTATGLRSLPVIPPRNPHRLLRSTESLSLRTASDGITAPVCRDLDQEAQPETGTPLHGREQVSSTVATGHTTTEGASQITADSEAQLQVKPWYAKRKRLTWILVAIIISLLATAAVLEGSCGR